MKLIYAVAIILVTAFALFLPLNHDIASAQTTCVQSLTGAVTNGAWTSDCVSENDADIGTFYARFYTFTLDEPADVTITLTSDIDTYLYLLSGTGKDGAAVRHTAEPDGTSSRIQETLQAGDYTIEATTYYIRETGDFTLTTSGIGGATTPSPSPTPPAPSPTPAPSPSPTPAPSPTPPPSPSPTPSPPPTPSECVDTLGGASATVDGAWASNCLSQNRSDDGEYYARYYTFTLDRQQDVIISLTSRTDAYLFLLDGSGMNGDVLAENDDYEGRNSRIRATLGAGAYTIEATTYAAGAIGDFTLAIRRPDLEALTALYNATDGANWVDNANWLTNAPLSEWHGITTDDQGRITEIYLIGNGLTGTIPPEVGDLAHLEGLYLARNELSGAIPAQLGDLSALQRLMLFDNKLSGLIPAQLGFLSDLEQLNLGRNELSGEIPAPLGRLSNLQGLHLTRNRLSGEIPDELGELASLRTLALGSNELSGEVPRELADMSSLTHLYLWGNDLTGYEFMPRLGELSNLQFLDIGGNRIEGSLALPQLAQLDNLSGLGIHGSELTDAELLPYIGSLQGLEFLNISGNRLSDAQTLARLANITTLQRLAIHGNRFSGELPRAMTQLSLMRIFYFHDNAGLCAPADAEFQQWLQAVNDFQGDICTGTPAQSPIPNQAPTPNNAGADQLASVPDSSGGPDSINES